MKATHDQTKPCIIWTGEAKRYQTEAAAALVGCGMEPPHLSWITPTCLNDCLEPTHLRTHAPLRIAYPYGVCIYCGRPSATKDHLLPRAWSGETQRKFVATVPACGTCNSLLNATLTWSITERRDICHQRIRRHFYRALRTVDFTADELAEFGRVLRADVEDAMARKREVLRMLAWPDDPNYDLRALQHSGIEDPYAIGLLGDYQDAS